MTGRAKILIVEDEALIAMELGERVEELGYAVLGPALTLEEADAAIARERPDAALLDVNLDGKSTVELGVALDRVGVAIAFCTGYDRVRGLPQHLASAPILTKPVSDADLKAVLKKIAPPR